MTSRNPQNSTTHLHNGRSSMHRFNSCLLKVGCLRNKLPLLNRQERDECCCQTNTIQLNCETRAGCHGEYQNQSDKAHKL